MCSIRLKQERVIATEQNVNVNSGSVEIVNYKMGEEEEKR